MDPEGAATSGVQFGNYYTASRTITGFIDSINCLQFNCDASLLAAGCDDGLFVVLGTRRQDPEVLRFRVPLTAVTSVMWHPKETDIVFVGYSDGGIVACSTAPVPQLSVDASPIPVGFSGPVEALSFSPRLRLLAAIVGSHVVLSECTNEGVWASRALPSPPSEGILPHASELLPLSLQFVSDNGDLVVSYLYHGIICWDTVMSSVRWRILPSTRVARVSLSTGGKAVVFCNLLDGFDIYEVATGQLMRRFPIDIVENIPLPVLFIHEDDEGILCGSDHGEVIIFDVKSGRQFQVLQHPDREIIQAIAYRSNSDADWIATGTSERGKDTKRRERAAGTPAWGILPIIRRRPVQSVFNLPVLMASLGRPTAILQSRFANMANHRSLWFLLPRVTIATRIGSRTQTSSPDHANSSPVHNTPNMKRRFSLVLANANPASGFGPPQRKMRTLNRRRFSYQQPHVNPGEQAGYSLDTNQASCSDPSVCSEPACSHSAGQIDDPSTLAVSQHVPEPAIISQPSATPCDSPFVLDAPNSIAIPMDVDINEAVSPDAAAYKHAGVQTDPASVTCPPSDCLRAAAPISEFPCLSSGPSHRTQTSQALFQAQPPIGTLVEASWDSSNTSSPSLTSADSSPARSVEPEEPHISSDEALIPVDSSPNYGHRPIRLSPKTVDFA
ncbi:WD40 repeat-like protein [Trametes sanguinea]|nr:WD40 repeat-like protein [Trametes sanguinea]